MNALAEKPILYMECERCGKTHHNSLDDGYYDLCEECDEWFLRQQGDTQ